LETGREDRKRESGTWRILDYVLLSFLSVAGCAGRIVPSFITNLSR
jgi:hypothetical protein